jgi:hypothetical protein
MRLDADPEMGNTQGRVKQLDSRFFIRVWNSIGGSLSNGTTQPALWSITLSYPVGFIVTSPISLLTYQSVVAGAFGIDPAKDPDHWVKTSTPVYMPPVPIPKLATTPTDIEVPPQLMPSPDKDPIIIVTGNDALPITVLALITMPDVNK